MEGLGSGWRRPEPLCVSTATRRAEPKWLDTFAFARRLGVSGRRRALVHEPTLLVLQRALLGACLSEARDLKCEQRCGQARSYEDGKTDSDR